MHPKDVCVCGRSDLGRITLIYSRGRINIRCWCSKYVKATYLRGISIANRSAKCPSTDVHDEAECATGVLEVAKYSAIVVCADEAGPIVRIITVFLLWLVPVGNGGRHCVGLGGDCTP